MKAEVITGDCVEVMRQMEADTFDLCVTSPPYDNLRQYKGYSFDFEATARELYRVIKPGGVVVWVVNDETVDGSKTGASFRQALYFKDACGFNLHDTMIWHKGMFTAVGSTSVRYGPATEFMFVLSKGRVKTFNPIRDRKNIHAGEVGKAKSVRLPNGDTLRKTHVGKVMGEYGIRFNVWDIPAEMSNSNRLHPGQFPERLAYDHILSWSNEGDTVLDPFCGSGTTGKMAVIARRNFVGIEISEEYAELSRARINRAQCIPADIPRPLRNPIDTPLFNTEVA